MELLLQLQSLMVAVDNAVLVLGSSTTWKRIKRTFLNFFSIKIFDYKVKKVQMYNIGKMYTAGKPVKNSDCLQNDLDIIRDQL